MARNQDLRHLFQRHAASANALCEALGDVRRFESLRSKRDKSGLESLFYRGALAHHVAHSANGTCRAPFSSRSTTIGGCVGQYCESHVHALT